MEVEIILAFAMGAAVPLGLYLYNRYKTMTAPDSPGGEAITWDELVETFNDPEFWEHVGAVKEAIENMNDSE